VSDICECEAAICRTPGFWGTHPTETQTLLNAAPNLLICGVPVQAYDDCAVEGLCNAPKGNKKTITARHLLATALNCVLTSGDYTCGGNATPLGQLFGTCNTACAANNAEVMASCNSQLDCYNNGGQWIGGMCVLGTCSATGAPCGERNPCRTDLYPTNTCVARPGNCHDEPLDGGVVTLPEPPNPAEPQLCQAATKSTNTIFTSGVCPQ
jgi:hypothetical protein